MAIWTGWGRHGLCSKIRRLRIKLRLHTPLNPQHLPKRILRPRLNLKAIPFSPEIRVHTRVAELGRVRVDTPRSIDFAEFAFESGEPQTHLGCLPVWEDFECSFVDGASGGKAIVSCRFGDIDSKHLKVCMYHELVYLSGANRVKVLYLKLVFISDDLSCPIKYGHGAFS